MPIRKNAQSAQRYSEFNQGQQADTVATSNTGTFSLVALFKRLLNLLTGAANVVTGTATAGVASGVLVAARATRRSVIVSNTHATDAAWVGPGVVSAANGYSLPAGQQATFHTVAALNCLRSAGNNITLSFVEVYD